MGASVTIPPSAAKLTGSVALRGGGMVTVRPIRPEDEPAMVRFHQALSENSIHQRYAGMLKLDLRVAHARLARICSPDSAREAVLVAEQAGEIVAVARLVRLSGTREAEFALLVSDELQDHGLGHALLTRLIEVGRKWGLERIVAEILPDNVAMRRVCKEFGFAFHGPTGASKDLTT